jgi:hypothetical protein
MTAEPWALIRDHRAFFAAITAVVIVVLALSVWIIFKGCDPLDAAACITSKKDIITGTGAVLAGIAGLCAWMVTHWRENDRRRFETFLKMREEFRKNPEFSQIFKALDGDIEEIKLSDITDDDAAQFAGFLEEIAILVQSGVLPSNLAHYFFGYYVIKVTRAVRCAVRPGFMSTRQRAGFGRPCGVPSPSQSARRRSSRSS